MSDDDFFADMTNAELIAAWQDYARAIYEETASIKAVGRTELFDSPRSYYHQLCADFAALEDHMGPVLAAQARTMPPPSDDPTPAQSGTSDDDDLDEDIPF